MKSALRMKSTTWMKSLRDEVCLRQVKKEKGKSKRGGEALLLLFLQSLYLSAGVSHFPAEIGIVSTEGNVLLN
jgi:hypothetical protein